MTESKRTAQVLKRFRELYPDGIAWKFNDRIARSRPDAMFAGGTRVVFVEFKMPGNNLTPGQALELQKLRRSGFWTLLAVFEGKFIHVLSHEEGLLGWEDGGTYTVDEFCHFVA